LYERECASEEANAAERLSIGGSPRGRIYIRATSPLNPGIWRSLPATAKKADESAAAGTSYACNIHRLLDEVD
jgi:hypothetical protein